MSTTIAGDDDLEGNAGASSEDGQTLYEILQDLPVLFLLNKNDTPDFKGVE